MEGRSSWTSRNGSGYPQTKRSSSCAAIWLRWAKWLVVCTFVLCHSKVGRRDVRRNRIVSVGPIRYPIFGDERVDKVALVFIVFLHAQLPIQLAAAAAPALLLLLA